MKGKRLQNRNITLIVLVIIISSFVLGCGESYTQNQIPTDPLELNIEDSDATEAIVTEPEMEGRYTLEECKEKRGVFIQYEDGSFDRYPGGGYIIGQNSVNASIDGMFMYNSDVAQIPIITESDSLVVFCDSSYSLMLNPVNWENGALSINSDGMYGYGRILEQNKYGVTLYVYFENNEISQKNVSYIDGMPAQDYQLEVINEVVTPYEGMSSKSLNITSYGFKESSSVKLGIKQGSSIVEEEFVADVTFFDCGSDNRNWQIEDYYGLDTQATTNGYATVDIYDNLHNKEIPSGLYVMKLNMGRSYIAYLLNWHNS